nr:hypothetical protein Itr_chr03CG20550 [Ipomoea trifida]
MFSTAQWHIPMLPFKLFNQVATVEFEKFQFGTTSDQVFQPLFRYGNMAQIHTLERGGLGKINMDGTKGTTGVGERFKIWCPNNDEIIHMHANALLEHQRFEVVSIIVNNGGFLEKITIPEIQFLE